MVSGDQVTNKGSNKECGVRGRREFTAAVWRNYLTAGGGLVRADQPIIRAVVLTAAPWCSNAVLLCWLC